MRTRTIALAAIVVAALACPRPAPAATLTDNDVRGGWIADVGGQRVIYVLKVRDGRISGIYCSDCTNPDEVAFLQDGKVEAGGIAFRVLRGRTGRACSEMVRGRLENGRPVLTSTRERAPRAPATVTSPDARAAPDAKRIAVACRPARGRQNGRRAIGRRDGRAPVLASTLDLRRRRTGAPRPRDVCATRPERAVVSGEDRRPLADRTGSQRSARDAPSGREPDPWRDLRSL
jgi:hypothetical protein